MGTSISISSEGGFGGTEEGRWTPAKAAPGDGVKTYALVAHNIRHHHSLPHPPPPPSPPQTHTELSKSIKKCRLHLSVVYGKDLVGTPVTHQNNKHSRRVKHRGKRSHSRARRSRRLLSWHHCYVAMKLCTGNTDLQLQKDARKVCEAGRFNTCQTTKDVVAMTAVVRKIPRDIYRYSRNMVTLRVSGGLRRWDSV